MELYFVHVTLPSGGCYLGELVEPRQTSTSAVPWAHHLPALRPHCCDLFLSLKSLLPSHSSPLPSCFAQGTKTTAHSPPSPLACP